VSYPYHRPVAKLVELEPPQRALVGAIVRKNQAIIPRGDTTIQHGDHLFIVTTPDNVDAVNEWLELDHTP
jgi:trk system potassium uptake protein TrkA